MRDTRMRAWRSACCCIGRERLCAREWARTGEDASAGRLDPRHLLGVRGDVRVRHGQSGEARGGAAAGLQYFGGGMLIVLGLLMVSGLWGTWINELQFWFADEVSLPI